jgi:hypothetical protein
MPLEKKNLAVNRFAPFVAREITCTKADGKKGGRNVLTRAAGCMGNPSHPPVMGPEADHHGYKNYLNVREYLSKCANA